jgi:hypothetical protein
LIQIMWGLRLTVPTRHIHALLIVKSTIAYGRLWLYSCLKAISTFLPSTSLALTSTLGGVLYQRYFRVSRLGRLLIIIWLSIPILLGLCKEQFLLFLFLFVNILCTFE